MKSIGFRHFKKAVRAAGLPTGFRFQDLRHTCAALLISVGAGEYKLQQWLGHASASSLRPYRHLFEGHRDRLARGLDRVYRADRADNWTSAAATDTDYAGQASEVAR